MRDIKFTPSIPRTAMEMKHGILEGRLSIPLSWKQIFEEPITKRGNVASTRLDLAASTTSDGVPSAYVRTACKFSKTCRQISRLIYEIKYKNTEYICVRIQRSGTNQYGQVPTKLVLYVYSLQAPGARFSHQVGHTHTKLSLSSLGFFSSF